MKEINRGLDMYVKWEGVQGEKTRGGGVKESTFPRTGMRRGGGGGIMWKNGTLIINLV